MRLKLCWLTALLAVSCGDLTRAQPRGNSSSLAVSPSSDTSLHHRSRRDASSCYYNGELYRCFFSITCIFSGGTLMPGCGSLLYSCCVPEATKRHSGNRHDRGFRFPSFPLPPLTGGRQAPRRIVFRRPPPPPLQHQRAFGTGRRFSGARRPRHPIQHISGPSDEFSVQPPPPPPPPPPASRADGNYRRSHDFSVRPGLNEITKSSPVISDPECGVPQPRIQKRIIGGHEASYGELPWQTHIRILGYQCGGVLVSRIHVVTAAHCVHRADLKDIKVHLGEYDTKDTGFYPEPYPSAVRSVAEVRINPRFHYMLTQPDRFDVAVLRLDFPVEYRPNILPICLPADHADFTGHVAIVAGWGKTDNSFSKTGTNILNKVPVPIISNKDCLQWHYQKHIDLQLHAEMFCAGHESGQRDACLGDSGGPLIVMHGGRWTLAGITSAGFGCAVDHQPGIYHKVSSSASWIRDNILD